MAEESPRPGTEEDTEEEEGEEAAEAPGKVEAEEAAIPESPPPSSPESALPSPPPVVPELPTYPPVLSGCPPNVSPACYPSLEPVYSPEASAYSSPAVSGINLFANDGSFLELFKKKMEASSGGSQEASPEEKRPEPDKRRPASFVGKRRGGAKLALKTGIVAKKPKTDEEEILTHKGGAWAQYMAEVKKYKAHQCSDDDKTRPLVK